MKVYLQKRYLLLPFQSSSIADSDSSQRRHSLFGLVSRSRSISRVASWAASSGSDDEGEYLISHWFSACGQGTFKKYVRSRFPSLDPPPPPPCSSFIFERSLLPKLHSFWLELTLCLSISILVKFREKKLMMSTSIFG